MCPVRDEAPPGLVPVEVGREIGAGRARVGDDDGLVGQHLLQRRDQPLRPDRPCRRVGELGERRALRRPGAGHGRGGVARRRRAVGDGVVQHGQSQAGIADDGGRGLIVGADYLRVGVDVYDGRTAFGVAPAFRRDRAGPTADEDDQIRGLDNGAGRRGAAVAADDAEGERVAVADRALAADRRCDGRIQVFGHRRKLRFGAGDDDTTAADEQRRVRRQDRRGRGVDGGRVGRRAARREPAEGRVGPHRRGVDRAALHVDRQADVGRARAAAGHRREGAAHGGRQLVRPADHGVPFGQRPEQRLLVELGQGIVAARRDRHVGRDRQHRDRRLIGLDDAGQDVGRAAAARPLADADLAGDPGIGVGHVGGRALIAGQHVGHRVVEAVERVVERQAGVAAQAEDVLNAMQRQHADQRFRPGGLVRHGLTSGCRSDVFRQPGCDIGKGYQDKNHQHHDQEHWKGRTRNKANFMVRHTLQDKQVESDWRSDLRHFDNHNNENAKPDVTVGMRIAAHPPRRSGRGR